MTPVAVAERWCADHGVGVLLLEGVGAERVSGRHPDHGVVQEQPRGCQARHSWLQLLPPQLRSAAPVRRQQQGADPARRVEDYAFDLRQLHHQLADVLRGDRYSTGVDLYIAVAEELEQPFHGPPPPLPRRPSGRSRPS